MKLDMETLRGFFRSAPFVHALGIEPVAFERGCVTAELPIQPQTLQHTGQVHAGVSTTLADHCMGAAAQTLAQAGFHVITAELKVSLLRAAKGEKLVCEARVIKPGRQLMFTEAEVWSESSSQRQLVAKASATMAVLAMAKEE